MHSIKYYLYALPWNCFKCLFCQLKNMVYIISEILQAVINIDLIE